MHQWFTQKLNEMIGLAHYCQYPILKAHLILTQKAVNELYGKAAPNDECLKDVLPILINHAEDIGNQSTMFHLQAALDSIETSEETHDNIVSVNFNSNSQEDRSMKASQN